MTILNGVSLFLGALSLLIILVSFFAVGLRFKIYRVLAAVTLAVLIIVQLGMTQIRSAVHTHKASAQVVDLDFAQDYLTDEQRQMVDLAISEGMSVKASPVVVHRSEHVVLIFGEPALRNESYLDAVRMILEKFKLVGIEKVGLQDLSKLVTSPTGSISARALSLLSSEKTFFQQNYRGTAMLASVDHSKSLMDGDRVLDSDFREIQSKDLDMRKPLVISIESGELYSSSGETTSLSLGDARELRMATNIQNVFTKNSSEKLMIAFVKSDRVEAIGRFLESQLPEGYVIESVRKSASTK